MLTLPLIWNVPYRRNPFFTGREDILKDLHTTLTEGKTAALTQPQAISGLGGIGKTQPEHLHTATVLQNHARLLRKTNREVKAAELEAKAKTIRIKHTQKNLEQ